jgi:hypothetical protein
VIGEKYSTIVVQGKSRIARCAEPGRPVGHGGRRGGVGSVVGQEKSSTRSLLAEQGGDTIGEKMLIAGMIQEEAICKSLGASSILQPSQE